MWSCVLDIAGLDLFSGFQISVQDFFHNLWLSYKNFLFIITLLFGYQVCLTNELKVPLLFDLVFFPKPLFCP